MAKIQAISVSEKKGVRKTNVQEAFFEEDFGIRGDAHGGKWHRQVSLLAIESVNKMREKGLNVKSGDFAENITTEGLDLLSLPIGTEIKIGRISLIISQIGKICHHHCAIYKQAGDCVMPREGIFGVVRGSGKISVGEEIEVIGKKGISAAIITLSDRCAKGEREDGTGKDIENYLIKNTEISFIRKEIIPDEKDACEKIIKDFADYQKYDLIITNGSTGVSPRDIAPETIIPLLEKRLLGFEEAMRAESFKKTPKAIISRAACGVRGKSLIIMLPGSPRGAIENIGVVMPAIPHAVSKINGDKSDCA